MIKIWFDSEADYLDVIFAEGEGFFSETDNDRVMKKVDTNGNILGFSVLGISTAPQAFEATL